MTKISSAPIEVCKKVDFAALVQQSVMLRAGRPFPKWGVKFAGYLTGWNAFSPETSDGKKSAHYDVRYKILLSGFRILRMHCLEHSDDRLGEENDFSVGRSLKLASVLVVKFGQNAISWVGGGFPQLTPIK